MWPNILVCIERNGLFLHSNTIVCQTFSSENVISCRGNVNAVLGESQSLLFIFSYTKILGNAKFDSTKNKLRLVSGIVFTNWQFSQQSQTSNTKFSKNSVSGSILISNMVTHRPTPQPKKKILFITIMVLIWRHYKK